MDSLHHVFAAALGLVTFACHSKTSVQQRPGSVAAIPDPSSSAVVVALRPLEPMPAALVDGNRAIIFLGNATASTPVSGTPLLLATKPVATAGVDAPDIPEAYRAHLADAYLVGAFHGAPCAAKRIATQLVGRIAAESPGAPSPSDSNFASQVMNAQRSYVAIVAIPSGCEVEWAVPSNGIPPRVYGGNLGKTVKDPREKILLQAVRESKGYAERHLPSKATMTHESVQWFGDEFALAAIYERGPWFELNSCALAHVPGDGGAHVILATGECDPSTSGMLRVESRMWLWGASRSLVENHSFVPSVFPVTNRSPPGESL